MKKVYFLTEYKEFDCVSSLNRINILVNSYINEYREDLEFIKIVGVDETDFTVWYLVRNVYTNQESRMFIYYSVFKVL